MRLAITGAYGSGKTTLVRAAADRFTLRHDLLPAMQDPLGMQKAATACSPPQLVELTIRRLIERSCREVGDDRVSDGSLLHDWVFAKTLLLHGTNPETMRPPSVAGRGLIDGLLEPTRRAIRASLVDRYDVIVRLPIEFPMTEATPPVSEGFRHRSEDYLAEELALAEVRPVTVTGSLNQRLDQLGNLLAPSVAA